MNVRDLEALAERLAIGSGQVGSHEGRIDVGVWKVEGQEADEKCRVLRVDVAKLEVGDLHPRSSLAVREVPHVVLAILRPDSGYAVADAALELGDSHRVLGVVVSGNRPECVAV